MKPFKPELISNCCLNCGVCKAHLRERNRCAGCTFTDKGCKIHRCAVWRKNKYRFCYECNDFPCDKIRHLDKRYTERYHNTSPIKNGEFIKDNGIAKFVELEEKRHLRDGKVFCIHDGKCYEPVI